MSDAIQQLARLLRVGAPGGLSNDDALRSFAQLRSTPDEGRAIQALLAREAVDPLPEPILLALAAAVADRGEPLVAAETLRRSTSLPALMLRADLLEGAGDRSSALVLVEQVLGRDIDWPGARERRSRWSAAIGRSALRGGAGSVPTFGPMPSHGPFSILREAGRGGSATVYEAEDRDLGRRVALKVYHQPERDRPKLLHEARVAVAVAGEGVVAVLDADPDRGWLAMRWAPFGALASPTQPAPPAGWARPLAEALARVHEAGWVHNDVKPANVLLRAPARPMLADFGIARRIGELGPPGSPGYVSPERRGGRASDPDDDVYGFGRVLLVESGHAGSGAGDPWRELAAECTGPSSERPRNGTELVARIDRLVGAGNRR